MPPLEGSEEAGINGLLDLPTPSCRCCWILGAKRTRDRVKLLLLWLMWRIMVESAMAVIPVPFSAVLIGRNDQEFGRDEIEF